MGGGLPDLPFPPESEGQAGVRLRRMPFLPPHPLPPPQDIGADAHIGPQQGGALMDHQLKQLQDWISESRHIVFFGGAGVSTESGIPDFRSVDGLYHQQYAFPPETILSHSFFERNPEEFYRFYRSKMLFPQARPNAAHWKLAELEAAGKLTAVVTQNIDGLHQAAGRDRKSVV